MNIHDVKGILSYRNQEPGRRVPKSDCAWVMDLEDALYPMAARSLDDVSSEPASWKRDRDLLLDSPHSTLVVRWSPRGFDPYPTVENVLATAHVLNRIDRFDRLIEVHPNAYDSRMAWLLENGCTLLYDAELAENVDCYGRWGKENQDRDYWPGFESVVLPSEFVQTEKRDWVFAGDISDEVVDDAAMYIVSCSVEQAGLRVAQAVSSELGHRDPASIALHSLDESLFPQIVKELFDSGELDFISKSVQGDVFERYCAFSGDHLLDMGAIAGLPSCAMAARVSEKLANGAALCEGAVHSLSARGKVELSAAIAAYKEDLLDGCGQDRSLAGIISDKIGIASMVEAFKAGVPIEDVCA